MVEQMAVLGLARQVGDVTLGLRGGVILGGHVDVEGDAGQAPGGHPASGRHDLAPGGLVALSVDWRVLAAPRDPVTLTLGLQLGVAHTTTRSAASSEGPQQSAWTALDLRFGATVSRTFFAALTPYLAARVFGGPIFWGDALGTDTTHVQLALGLGWEVVPGLSLHVEGAALAERGVFGGLGLAF